MTVSAMRTERQTCFQFKTSFSPCTILQINHYDLDSLRDQLADVMTRAPKFFQNSPVVIDLDKIATELPDFVMLKSILSAQGIVPVGVRGGVQAQHDAALLAGLPFLSIGKLARETMPEKDRVQDARKSSSTRLVTQPIRSGMQMYAKDGDLVVTAPVSAGAELLSDGHIHVYGPLRGRALAGVQGDTKARIFCRALDAELVSIAGYYLTKEDMPVLPESHGMIQIYLDQDKIQIESIF